MSTTGNSGHSLSVSNLVSLLAKRIEPLCRELLPNGRREGMEWRCGSVNGEPGKSLGVHLVGAKAGNWADFAGDERGDALGLVKAVLSLDTNDAIKWTESWLGNAQVNIKKPRRSSGKTIHVDRIISVGRDRETGRSTVRVRDVAALPLFAPGRSGRSTSQSVIRARG